MREKRGSGEGESSGGNFPKLLNKSWNRKKTENSEVCLCEKEIN